MVVVDVQDRDPLGAAIHERLRHDGRVVEEAIAADEVAPGVMARRTAQPVGERRTRQHPVRGRQGDVDRRARGRGGAGHDRRGRIEAVRPQALVAARGQLLQRHRSRVAAQEERVGQERPAGVPSGGDRIGPGVLDEVQQLEVVDRRDRVRAVVTRRLERVGAGGQQRVANGRCSLRRLVARDLAAGHELDQPVVGEMVVGCDERCRFGWHRLNENSDSPVSSADAARRCRDRSARRRTPLAQPAG